MKPTLFIGAAVLAIGTYSIPMQAHAALSQTLTPILPIESTVDDDNGSFEVARRGRSGTGVRGRDRNRSQSRSSNGETHRSGGHHNGVRHHGLIGGVLRKGLLSGSNRRKPRIPGGSGCDDPGDFLEHAACRQ